MSEERNRRIIQRYFEDIINAGKLELLDSVVTPDIFYRGPINVVHGLAAVIGWLQEWMVAFPDCTYAIEYVVCEGNRAMCRTVLRGTHKETFRGVAATERRISLPAAMSFQIADGKISSVEAFYDSRLLFEQLGAALPPAFKVSGMKD
jgi:steroid delta-isomerase-like uncharacterized protein